MRIPIVLLALVSAACCTPAPANSPPPERSTSSDDGPAPPPLAETSATPEEIARGEQLAQMACVSCHAIGQDTVSPHPEAPSLSRLSEKYPVILLEEAFAEGIMVGHPDMPEFKLQPDDIRALLGYLESIQAKRGI